MRTIDALREANPDLGFAIYAYDPGGPVTLEVLTPDGKSYQFKGVTTQAAIELAFPAPDVSEKPTDDEPQTDVFS